MKLVKSAFKFIGEIAKNNPILFSTMSSIVTSILTIIVTCLVYDPVRAAFGSYTYLPTIEERLENVKKGTGITQDSVKELRDIDKEIHGKKAQSLIFRKGYERYDADVHERIGDYYTSLPGEIGGRENLEKAIEEYLVSKNILERYKEDYPDDYLRVLVSLGTAYCDLSGYKNRLDNLVKSRSLLEEATSDRSISNNKDELIRVYTGLGDVYSWYATMSVGSVGEDSREKSKDYYSRVFSLIKDKYSSSDEETYLNEYTKLRYKNTDLLISTAGSEDVPLLTREDNLLKAIDYLEEASSFWTPEEYPREYKDARESLGVVYLLLSAVKIDDRFENLEKGEKILEETLETVDKDTDPYLYIGLKRWIGVAYYYRFCFDRNYDNLEKAIEFFREALGELQNKKYTLTYEYALYQQELGDHLIELFLHSWDESTLREAIKSYEDSLRLFCSKDYPTKFEYNKYKLGFAYFELYSITGERIHKTLGVEQYEDALEMYAVNDSHDLTEDAVSDMIRKVQAFQNYGGYRNSYRDAKTLRIIGDVLRKREYSKKAIRTYSRSINLALDKLEIDAETWYTPYSYSTVMTCIGDCYLGAFYINNDIDSLKSAIIAYEESLKACQSDEIAEKCKGVKKTFTKLRIRGKDVKVKYLSGL